MEIPVILPLTEEQRTAIAASPDEPVRLIDSKTNAIFVLLHADEYARVRPLLEDDFDIRETYAAQFAAAMRAGWADPAMDEYDNYDEAYAKLCHSNEEKSS
jgi:hypothetical protein